MKCPPILQTLVIADDPHLAAKISCALAKAGHYLPVMEAPRMQRQDRDIEVVRKNNGAARLRPTSIFLTGLPDDAFQALTTRFTSRLKSKIQRVSNEGEIDALWTDRSANSNVVWGRDRIGLGLLKALRAGSGIVFEDKPSPNEAVPSKSLHLVVCEEGDELAQVIAANYAFSLKAGLCLIDRTLVVDIAIGVARTDDDNMLNVTQFMRFISLDGVDWNDPKKAERLYVGRAILDFIDKTRGNPPERLEPVKKQTVSRVLGSAALKMYDQNIIVLPRPLADEGTPIIINNACVSWHRLAQSFTFSNARAYVGTLFPVHPYEAQEVVIKLLGKHFGKPLPTALWSAQREVYGSIVRRPYVMTGVYPQYLRIKRHNVAAHIGDRLFHALNAWRKTLPRATPNQVKMVKETITFYERELEAFRKRWLQ